MDVCAQRLWVGGGLKWKQAGTDGVDSGCLGRHHGAFRFTPAHPLVFCAAYTTITSPLLPVRLPSPPLSLQVPAGVDAGSRLRVRGEGNSGRRGGEPGDLYVYITIKDHPELRRDGITIHSDVEISYVDAILGTQVKVRSGGGRGEG